MIKNLNLFFLLVFASLSSYGQLRITGQVIDNHYKPVSLATVDLIGAAKSATTDDSGVFFLTLPEIIKKGDLITLRTSKPGYKINTKHVVVSSLSIPIKLFFKSPTYSIKLSKAQQDKLVPNETKGPFETQPINVTSINQSGGITASQVIITPQIRKLDERISNQLLNILTNSDENIEINTVFGDSEAFQFATQVLDFLKIKGYKNATGVNQSVFSAPVFGQHISRDSLGVHIIIGSRQ